MSYTIQNNSEISVLLAKAIKAELIRELGCSEDVAHLVVNHYDLEARGLGKMMKEIAGIVKTVTNEF
jgi:hypothetical protein